MVFTEDTRKSKSLAIQAAGKKRELRRVRIKIVMTSGPVDKRLLLLNSTLKGEVIPANVVKADGKNITVDQSLQVFVDGVYTSRDCKGKNYINTKFGPYTSGTLFHGGIGLPGPLPAGTKQVYIKPLVQPEGIGYDFTEGGTLDETAYKVASDMWKLDDFRLANLASKGVVNEGLTSLHNEARRYIDLADKAKNSLNYSVFDSYCRAAWGYEARAYPDVTSTAQDVVNGVIFYLFLMLPFAYFCERLFFAFSDLRYQLAAFFAIFLAVFGIFCLVHPAFQIAGLASLVVLDRVHYAGAEHPGDFDNRGQVRGAAQAA